MGIQALDLRLLHGAGAFMESGYVGVPGDFTVMSVDDAIRVLAYHKKQMDTRRPAWNAMPVDVEAVKAQIIRRTRALDAKAAKKRL